MLTWLPNPRPHVVFHVYRWENNVEDKVLIATVDFKGSTTHFYTDETAISGRSYYYSLDVFDDAGQNSGLSEPVFTQ